MSTDTSIQVIDCYYFEPEHAASFLLVEGNEAVFIENNTVHAIPRLMEALKQRGLAPESVRYLIITHLHLDHGGGTSALVRQCPNATVLAHPRAVRHLVDPSRLIEGVKAVYGEAEFERLYAPITSIDGSRVHGVQDGEVVSFGTRNLTFLHTPGHAHHHVCIHDSGSNGVFTGDTFGVEYNAKRQTHHPFLLCSTAPTDFDPAAMRSSIQRILDTGAERVYLTHYGELRDVVAGAESLGRSLADMEQLLNAATDSDLREDALQQFCRDGMRNAFHEQAQRCGASLSDSEWSSLERGIAINAQGIAYVASRRRTNRQG